MLRSVLVKFASADLKSVEALFLPLPTTLNTLTPDFKRVQITLLVDVIFLL